MLALVLVLGIAALPVSAEPSSVRFLRIVSHVNYETVNPNEDLLIVIQTDSRIGFIEWYFDYIHSESYHRIPFVNNEGCNRMGSSVHIEVDGNVYPCGGIPVSMGNVKI